MHNIIRISFTIWHTLFQRNEQKFDNLHKMKYMHRTKESFIIWRSKIQKLLYFKSHFRSFVQNSRDRYIKQSLSAWREFNLHKKYKTERWKLATFFFLERKLRKVMHRIKSYSSTSKKLKGFTERKDNNMLKEFLKDWKLAFIYTLLSKRINYRRAYYLLSESIVNLYKYAQKQKYSRRATSIIYQRTNTNLVSKYFKLLSVSTATKIRYKFMSNNHSEGLLRKRIRNIFMTWKLWSYKKHEKLKIITLFGKCRCLTLAHKFLFHLQEKTENSKFKRAKIAPFIRRKYRKYLRKVLLGWFEYTEKKNILQNNLGLFIQDHQNKVKSKVFLGILRYFTKKLEIGRRSLYFENRKRKKALRQIFGVLVTYSVSHEIDREAYAVISSKNNKKIKQLFFWRYILIYLFPRWIDNFNDQQDLADTMQISEE